MVSRWYIYQQVENLDEILVKTLFSLGGFVSNKIQALLFGAGDRGLGAYGQYALLHPEEFQFVAVAEPNQSRRVHFAELHKIPPSACFETWEQALAAGRIADVVVNCTLDRMHYKSGMAALNLGYDMLLEKPICHTLKKTIKLVKTAEVLNRTLMVCHVLRYTEFFQKVYEILHSNRLGQLITVSLRENVAAHHMAHSYVRGNWRSSQTAVPMILAKSCHDMDLLYWLIGEPVRSLSSVGNLRHFRPEYAPKGAPQRCTDGCPADKECPFYAPSIYLDLIPIKNMIARSNNKLHRSIAKMSLQNPSLTNSIGKVNSQVRQLTQYQGWPRSVITDNPASNEAVLQALREGPYGRCVYFCDNDVVDHQIVNMEFLSGISATFTMHGHSYEEGRTMRVDGSAGTLLAKFSMGHSYFEIWNHQGALEERVDFSSELESKSGHGGGDFGLMQAFINSVHGKKEPLAGANHALESHLMAFAAEESRLTSKTINMHKYKKVNKCEYAK